MRNGLPPLVDVDDITARLGRDLTDSEEMRIESLLRDASSQIRRYCRSDFAFIENDLVDIRADGAIIKLPDTPVWDIAAVMLFPGGWLQPFSLLWWRFDGIDEIMVPGPGSHGVINYPEIFHEDWFTWNRTFRVMYTHGPQEVPEEVAMVAANSVIAVLTAPTQAAGVIGETVGAYSYRLERSGGGLAVTIQPQDLAILNDYRNKQMTHKLSMLCRFLWGKPLRLSIRP